MSNDDATSPSGRSARPEPTDDVEVTGSLRLFPGGGAVDWETLNTRARIAMTRAYAPYSGYPVGAAGLVEDLSLIHI